MKIRSCLNDVISSSYCKRSAENDYAEYVDTLFGVGSSTVAGPTMPNGSIHPSCETLEKDCGGYYRNQPIIGFGHAYTSGAGGVKCYGNFLLSPMVDKLTLDASERASMVVKGEEIGKCYEYRTLLENGIKTRVTPTHNCAVHVFEYPAGHEAFLLLDVAHKLDVDACMKEGYVRIDAKKRRISGGGLCSGNWNYKDWNMYFVLEFDSDFQEIGGFCDDKFTKCEENTPLTLSINEMKRLGAYIKFGNSGDKSKVVSVKIAVSFTGESQALKFLDEQICDFDYEDVKARAKEAWNTVLGAIELDTTDKELLRRIYTAVYHMNIQPRNRMNDSGVWDDFHTVWDTWKTVFPLYSLIYPEKMADIVESFADRAEKNRRLNNGIVLADQYMTARETLPGQGGNDTDNVLVDAYLRGVRLKRYEWEDIYGILLESAEKMRTREYVENGYSSSNAKTVSGIAYSWRFKPAASTMGYAFNDKAISNMARELGTEEEYLKYLRRSRNWLNVWNYDLSSEGFFGFPQSRNENGEFDADFDAHQGYNTHFYEATAWDAAYINYNDSENMISAMGGKELFTERLLWACNHSKNYFNDDHGKEGYLNFTNEPSFQIPWLFCVEEINRPDFTAVVLKDVIKRFSLPNDYPGDEDNGGMSSYYIFLMCGIFPFATTDMWYLHGTRIKKITLHLGNGKNFTVTGENIGEENIYVQNATLNGKELNRCSLTNKEILSGGHLHFVMGNTPSDWCQKNN